MVDNPKPIRRRNVLMGIGSVTGVIGLGGNVTGFEDDEVEIVIAEHKGVPLETATVSNEWYYMATRSRRVRSILLDNFTTDDWFKAVTRRKGVEEVGGGTKFKIIVETTDIGEAKKELPEELLGFQIEVDEFVRPYPECEDDYYDCVPGGARVRSENPDGSYSTLSGTCIVEWDGDYHYMTAAHGFSDDCGAILGQELRQGTSWSSGRMGDVVNYYNQQDWAIVELADDTQVDGFDNIIIGHIDVIGNVTKDGVQYLIDSDEEVNHYGAATCDTSGVVTGDSYWDPCDTDDPQPYVLHSTHTEGGDSGGPHYRTNSFGDANIIGPTYGKTSTDAWACAAYEIKNTAGIEFGADSPYC